MKKPEGYNEGNKQRRYILSMCYKMGWTVTKTSLTGRGTYTEPDYERLNNWMLKYSYLHKPLNEYAYKELSRLVTQFKGLYYSQKRKKSCKK